MGDRYRNTYPHATPRPSVPAPCRPLIEVHRSPDGTIYVVCFRVAGTAHSQSHQTFEAACEKAKRLADFFDTGFVFVQN